MYSRGVGPIRFASKVGYSIIIHDVLFVPGLASKQSSPRKPDFTYGLAVAYFSIRLALSAGLGPLRFQ